MKKLTAFFRTAGVLAAVFFAFGCTPEAEGPHYINIESKAELYQWFRYSPDRPIVVSGHRGGMETGYPENCIESFEHTLSYMQSFFEIDPCWTKDSVMVLMHDSTIDRTTNGKGKVADYTYDELQKFFLKDRDGNVTTYKIPTLAQAIEWSKGKTILNLDFKDIPLGVMAEYIASVAPVNVIYTVHNAAQAKLVLSKDPDAAFSLWCKNMKEFRAYDEAGIPWERCQAYVGHFMSGDNQQELYDNLHKKGVMCMISTAPTHDHRTPDAAKIKGYELEIGSGCDVIETDYPYLFKNLDLNRK